MKNKSLYGTAIMAVWTPDEIVVSADSRGSERDGSVINDDNCKILQFAGGYVTIAGCRDEEDAGYNFEEIMNRVSNPNMPLFINVHTLENEAKPLIEAAANLVKNEDPDAFVRNFLEKSPLTFCVFGLEQGAPRFFYREYIVENPDAGTVSMTINAISRPETGKPEPIGLMVGAPEHRTNYGEKFRANPYETSLVDFSREFVQVNIDDGDGSVGGAIDTIRITRAGVEWVERKGNC